MIEFGLGYDQTIGLACKAFYRRADDLPKTERKHDHGAVRYGSAGAWLIANLILVDILAPSIFKLCCLLRLAEMELDVASG